MEHNVLTCQLIPLPLQLLLLQRHQCCTLLCKY